MKKKMLAILLAGLMTILGSLSVSAANIEKEKATNPVMPLGADTGGIGVVVFYEQITETDDIPTIVFITDATVTCVDLSGETHEMSYIEFEPDFYAYIVDGIPIGSCEITASKGGFGTVTDTFYVPTETIDIYKLKMDKDPASRPILFRLLDIFPNGLSILRLLASLL